MRYRVHGVNRTTGQPISQTIEAFDEPEAHVIAQRSIIVSEIEPELPPTDVLEYSPRAGVVPLAKPAVPIYQSILTWIAVLRVVGVVCFAGCALAAFAAVECFINAQHGEDGPLLVTWGASALFGAIVLVAIGAVLWMLVALAEAVRDMAQNSFRTRDRD